jgi:hypothetical protein
MKLLVTTDLRNELVSGIPDASVNHGDVTVTLDRLVQIIERIDWFVCHDRGVLVA